MIALVFTSEKSYGRMVELVDTLALGASGASHEGSSPSPPTIKWRGGVPH